MENKIVDIVNETKW